MSKVILKNLTKAFGSVVAVDDLSLAIHDGEFFSILGPSGCGKTTTLRLIAGLETPDAGEIDFDGRRFTRVPPQRRNTGMVFQNYALFPHMTVFENVAFGLKARGVPKREIAPRVHRACELVRLSGLENRPVTVLSGGQQQRVALARALVIRPQILLLDEPLSNLDARLREETRLEIKALQQRLGITTLYVTHDQEEALVLSDRLAVMNQGRCHQVGTPEEIYANPGDRFVATFLGKTNYLEGYLRRSHRGLVVEINPAFRLSVLESQVNGKFDVGQSVAAVIRPEAISLSIGGANGEALRGTVVSRNFTGAAVEYQVEVAGTTLRVVMLNSENSPRFERGQRVLITIPANQVKLL